MSRSRTESKQIDGSPCIFIVLPLIETDPDYITRLTGRYYYFTTGSPYCISCSVCLGAHLVTLLTPACRSTLKGNTTHDSGSKKTGLCYMSLVERHSHINARSKATTARHFPVIGLCIYVLDISVRDILVVSVRDISTKASN